MWDWDVVGKCSCLGTPTCSVPHCSPFCMVGSPLDKWNQRPNWLPFSTRPTGVFFPDPCLRKITYVWESPGIEPRIGCRALSIYIYILTHFDFETNPAVATVVDLAGPSILQCHWWGTWCFEPSPAAKNSNSTCSTRKM